MSDVTLRPIRPDDEAFLFRVYASTREEELAPLQWSEEQKRAFLQMQFRAQHQHYQTYFPAARFDVVVWRDQPIGRLYVDRREDEIRIIDIALLPEFRRQGFGSRMLREILDEATQPPKPVRIHVERFNPALKLYERLGFTRTGDTGVYYLMEWKPAGPSAAGRVD